MSRFASIPYTMPDVSPLYPELPYRYLGYRKLSVIGRADERSLRAFLPAPFELAYYEAGVVLSCRFRDRLGGHVTFEYVSTDDSLGAGREIWGYPKKLADVRLWDEGGRTHASCTREGQLLVGAVFSPGRESYAEPVLNPRLQLKRIPQAQADVAPRVEIVWNELTERATHSQVWGKATLELGDVLNDRLSALGPTEIVGAQLIVGDFLLGYGQVIATI
jgi:acetoacetate decarboxylase